MFMELCDRVVENVKITSSVHSQKAGNTHRNYEARVSCGDSTPRIGHNIYISAHWMALIDDMACAQQRDHV